MQDLNSVTLVGRLTKDPELTAVRDTTVTTLRVAFNSSRKNQETNQWEDVPNFVDVKVWGGQGESCAKFLSKGSQVAVKGRLAWREWTTPEGQKRQALDIVSETVQFVGGKSDSAPRDPVATTTQAAPATDDSDIPF